MSLYTKELKKVSQIRALRYEHVMETNMEKIKKRVETKIL